jgi:hypothetical protein
MAAPADFRCIGDADQQVHAFICPNHAESVVDNAEVRGERYHIWDTELAGFGLRMAASGTKTFKNS